jgi:hypothetical protein
VKIVFFCLEATKVDRYWYPSVAQKVRVRTQTQVNEPRIQDSPIGNYPEEGDCKPRYSCIGILLTRRVSDIFRGLRFCTKPMVREGTAWAHRASIQGLRRWTWAPRLGNRRRISIWNSSANTTFQRGCKGAHEHGRQVNSLITLTIKMLNTCMDSCENREEAEEMLKSGFKK